MEQNWIEFKIKDDKFLSLRPEYITKYSMTQEGPRDVTIVMYEEGDFTKNYYVNEPYEQVKQKIMDAEKVDLNDVVVERFSEDEYKTILSVMKAEKHNTPDHDTGEYQELRRIVDKLNKIIEEVEMSNENTTPKTVNVLATSKLANIQIADEDYHEGNKYLFTFEEALKVEESLKDMGWRLPTRSEWVLLCEEFAQKDGELNGEMLCNNLKLIKHGFYGYYSGSLNGEGSVGYYWSRTAFSGDGAYNLYFDSSGVGPQDTNNRGVGFALRLVRDLKS